MPYYATVAQVKTEIKGNTTTAADEAILLDLIRFTSERIDAIKQTTFEPWVETRYADFVTNYIYNGGRTLVLNDTLLSFTSAVLPNALAITASDVTLSPLGWEPAREITLKSGEGYWDTYVTNPAQAVSVTGIWGYRTRYSTQGWASAGTLGAAATDSATTLTVSDGTLFADGNLIKIGTEFIRVTDISSNTLTVTRGENGSTAAAHDNGDAVAIWQPEPLIVRACIRWVGYVYFRRGSFEQNRFDPQGFVVNVPQDAPAEVWNILREVNNEMNYGTP